MEESLLMRSCRMVHGHRRSFEDRGDHMVIRTPTNPSFYGGNTIWLGSPPTAFEPLEALFVEGVGDLPHRAFEWVGGKALEAEFTAAGYAQEVCACMAVERPTLDGRVEDFRIERLRGELAWVEALEFWVGMYPQHGFSFHARRASNIRDRKGSGDWWVARSGDGRIVGSMGLYFGDGMGRFQNVDTHPAFRRLGVCRTLMHHVLEHAVAHHDFERIVIASVEGSVAQGIYRSFGFETVHLQTDAVRTPKK